MTVRTTALWVSVALAIGTLAGQSPVEVHVRLGHLGDVTAVAFSADGRTLATAGQRGIVKLWGTDTGLLLGTLETGATYGIHELRFSPDGVLLASAPIDEEPSGPRNESAAAVKIWDVPSRTLRSTFRVPAVPAASRIGQRTVEFLNDRTILVWGQDGGVGIDIATQTKRWGLSGTLQTISDEKRFMAVSVSQGELSIRDPVTGAQTATLPGFSRDRDGPLGNPRPCMPRDGSWIAIPRGTSRGANVSLYNATTGQQVWTRDFSSADFAAVVCAASGETVVVFLASRNAWRRDAVVFDATNGDERARFVIGEVQMRDWSLSPDGRTLAIITADQQGHRSEIALWDTESGARRLLAARDEPRTGGESRVTFSPDASLVAVSGPSGEMRLFETAAGRQRWMVSEAVSPTTLLMSQDGSRLVAVSDPGYAPPSVSVWNPATGERLAAQFERAAHVVPLVDRNMVVVDGIGRLELWDMTTRRARWSQEQYMTWLGASSDGSAIAWAEILNPRMFHLLDAASGRQRCTIDIKSDRYPYPFMELSPDGALAAVSGFLTTVDRIRGVPVVAVFDARNCRRLTTLAGSLGARWIQWSPDGAVLVVSREGVSAESHESTVYWDARTWRMLRTERGYHPVNFSQDGKRIVRLADDGNFEVVAATTGEKIMTLRHPALRVYQPLPPSPPLSGLSPAAAFSPDGTIVWTARQGELHAWTAHDGRLRATLSVLPIQEGGAAADWVAFTPDGYWDGSPGAERYLNWRVDGRATQAPDIVRRFQSADRIRTALTKPPGF
ncbi:MAG TPA: WD40 repeat domain-containing protein [Vicinamibacterales bacterium]|nr:WD40 repeat domain-containing protein [Vicinamibacterales bacterium]